MMCSTQTNQTRRSVCVIGAGAAGLCALRHFTTVESRHYFGPIVCFEQNGQIGGVWSYSECMQSASDGTPLHSSMYRDLRTLAPVQIMGYPDFELQSSKSYLAHTKILQYIRDYAEHFSLMPHIQFNSHLQLVTREKSQWHVTVVNVHTNQFTTHQFDIIVLAPGRFWIPHWPTSIPTLAQFTGVCIHSHDYRARESFTGQRVAVIGASASGMDICMELSTVAKQVILINRTETQFENLLQNVNQIKSEIHQFGEKSIELRLIDSESESASIVTYQIDAVIFATGYRLNLNFVDQTSCGLRLNSEDTLDGVYRHLVNIAHPSMALLSIIEPTISFPLYHQQIRYFIKLLLSQICTPTQTEMHAEVQTEIAKRKSLGYAPFDRHLFKLDLMAEYFRVLEREASLEPKVKPVTWSLLKEMERQRSKSLIKFREFNYRLVDEQTFEQI